jgi:hypothetical protein
MDNVTLDKLKKIHGDKALDAFSEIALLGGFGQVTTDHLGGIDPNFEGGLDLVGVLDPDNKAVSDAKKNKIRELVGMGAEKEAEPKGKK